MTPTKTPNPFTAAIVGATTLIQDATSAISSHVNTVELFNAAAKGALEGVLGGPVGITEGAMTAVVTDLPNIVTPADQKLVLAAFALAEEIYARIHPSTTPAPALQ